MRQVSRLAARPDLRATVTAAALVASAAALWAATPAAGVRLDHLPIAVHDLPAAEREFGALGFTIKPGRPHTNGIANASIKFADGSYLELITARNATDETAREYVDLLARQEGAAYAFLRDDPDGRFTTRILDAGGRREQSGPFVLTALPPAWRLPRLQLIAYPAPAVDPPEIMRHANGATRLVAMWVVADEPGAEALATFGAADAGLVRSAFAPRAARIATLADGTCLAFARRRAEDPPRSTAIAAIVEIEPGARLSDPRLQRRGDVRWLAPSDAHGVWLGFVERAAWSATRCAD